MRPLFIFQVYLAIFGRRGEKFLLLLLLELKLFSVLLRTILQNVEVDPNLLEISILKDLLFALVIFV